MRLASHWVGGEQKIPSHLAAVWRPRGQSSHLSSLIKATGICMTAPSPFASFCSSKGYWRGNVQQLWQRIGPRITLVLSTRPLIAPGRGPSWPYLLYTTNLHLLSSILPPWVHFFFFSRTRKAAPPPAIPQTPYYMILAIVVKNL